MEQGDMIRSAPRPEPLERLKETHPQEKRRQTALAGEPEAVEEPVPLSGPAELDRLAAALEKASALLPVEKEGERSIRFSVDEDTRQLVVRIVDEQSNEVLRQIPPEVVLRNLRNLEELKGLLFDGVL